MIIPVKRNLSLLSPQAQVKNIKKFSFFVVLLDKGGWDEVKLWMPVEESGVKGRNRDSCIGN